MSTGMRAFTIVWLGQLVSLTGTAMTQFAITIWAWERTNEATALALVGFCSFAPSVIFSPLAGALVDRWNRKLVMMLSDLAAGLSTIALLLLYTSGSLQIWHLCAAGAFASTFQAFQFPAYSAAVSMMVSKEQYVRAHAMLGLAESASAVFAPVVASFLLGIIQLNGIMTIDAITFIVAIGALLFVHIPQPEVPAGGRTGQGSLLHESVYGFRYIFARPSLLGLQLVFFSGNLIAIIAYILFSPMILARTGNNEVALGLVYAAFGLGGVIGGIALARWGGPKRKVHGVLMGWLLVGLLTTLMGIGQSLAVWVAAAFINYMINPVVNASNQAIWQTKVAPDIQGRVFAARRLIAQITIPLGMILAGPLADRLFEPAMAAGGSLARVFGGLVGVGPGAGMGLIVAISGLLTAGVGLAGYAVRAIRDAEDILPDHDAKAKVEPADVAVAEVVLEES
jgi:MFS transporter, DHA3 family, macrolide efflux protein